MNKARLEKCRMALATLNRVHSTLEILCDKEQDCVSNCPENFQNTQRYERSEEAAENLSEALSSLGDAINSLEKVV